MIDEVYPAITVDGLTQQPAPQPGRFLARQPILDARGNTLGYELLFREGWENTFSGEPNHATRQILDHCAFIGLSSLTQKGLAFVNCTREALVDGLVTLLPAKSTVLEILETVEPDAELVDACRTLRGMGYALALDDFVPQQKMESLVELASYVKVDYQASNAAQRRLVDSMVRGSGATLLAEKIESQQDFNQALAEGYEYFQGYFFCRPRIVASTAFRPVASARCYELQGRDAS
jgi:EAL and modified HD-GYP domain-containing signal transduction protein